MSPGSHPSPPKVSGKIKAEPTKDFFLKMITRDISLRDCIFDLLDNSIDGARRSLRHGSNDFSPFEIRLNFTNSSFDIADNCGGITLNDAIDYAFHFGKKKGAPSDVEGGIGLYGIGMKRAIFKIGRYCQVESHATDASFTVTVDVSEWEAREGDWDFNYEDLPRAKGSFGTRIRITQLNEGVAATFGDPGFRNGLLRDLARDYAFFIQQGLKITAGTDEVPTYRYQLRQSDEVTPLVEDFHDGPVHVKILAGLVDDLPDDIPDELRPGKVERYGWFVICNNRVVLAADKTEQTVWGDDGFQVWHPQYNGFAGFVFFFSADQRQLPWTTTKRSVDASSPLYRRTIDRMKRVTQEFIVYTNQRKLDLDYARSAESSKVQVDVRELIRAQPLRLPQIKQATATPQTVTISYPKTKTEVDEIKRHLGDISMTAKEVGKVTFEYFQKVELGK